MKEDITCVFQGVGNCGAIYISNLKAAQDTKLLGSLQIRALVSAVRGAIVKHQKESVSDHLYVPADDVQSYDISSHFQQTFNFIDNARKKTNVLVHCYAGISRSATIVIAYLIRKYDYSLEKVIGMVKRKRNKIHPNKGFLEQLRKEAVRIGHTPNQNQQPIQQFLSKQFSPVKKKGVSNFKKRNEELRLQLNKKTVLSSAEEQKIAQPFLLPQEVPMLLEQEPLTDSKPKSVALVCKDGAKQKNHFFHSTTAIIMQRSQKIESKILQLKSRILESHRKKLVTKHKRSLSENKNESVVQLLGEQIDPYRKVSFGNLNCDMQIRKRAKEVFVDISSPQNIFTNFSLDLRQV